jgi:hypothetical protein
MTSGVRRICISVRHVCAEDLTNAVESVNARIRKAVKAQGDCPTELAALTCVYLAGRSLVPTGKAFTTGFQRLDQQ